MMEFKVPEMSCGHCVAAIEKSVKGADPAATVECNLQQRLVKVDSILSAAEVALLMSDAGYKSETSGS